jgi:hypothetical protein
MNITSLLTTMGEEYIIKTFPPTNLKTDDT